MTPEQTSKGRGCFFYGCLTAVVVLVVALIGGYLGFRYVVNKLVNTYTDSAPLTIPTVETSQAEADALLERVRIFKEALNSGGAEPMVINTKDLNTLIAYSPDFRGLKGKAYLTIEGDAIRGQISIPLDDLPFPRVKGRYLNGEASVKASLENGVLLVTLDSLRVKGKDAPDEVLAALRKENLARDVYRNADTARILSQLDSIQIKDDKLIIQPRAKSASP